MDGVSLCLSDEEAVLLGLFGPDCVVRASIRMEVGDLRRFGVAQTLEVILVASLARGRC